MKKQYILKLILTSAFTFLAITKSFSQSGNIQGTISDENGVHIPGANITITTLKKGDITDFDGKFTIVNIPVGTYDLKVSYLGYKDITKKVEVLEGKTSEVFLVLKTTDILLDEIQVVSSRLSGQARALNTQKNNINITNVVSTEQIGKFPDANIGDAVRRISGITMQVDQGEARNIIVRGLAPQLNSVTLNGTRIPSAEGDNRNIQMDLIPSDMIQTIQVNKAITPDMDADAIGGAVNLVTRAAPQNFRFSATAGSGINTITGKRILNGSFLVGDRSKNKKFGWMVGATINDNDFGSDNIEFEWDDSETDFVNEHDIRTYLVQRVRRSFSINFDYKIDNENEVYFKSMYNWRDDRENRYRLRYTDIEEVNGVLQAQIRRQTKGGIDNNRNKDTRLEDQRMQNYTLGGNHIFGKLQMDWLASVAVASEERLNERYISYRIEDIPVNADLSNPEFPVIIPISNPGLSNYELREITEENQFTEEKDYNTFLNFKLPIAKGSLKFGLRTRFKEKFRDNNFFEFEPINASTFSDFSSLPLTNQTDANYLAGSQYVAGNYVDPRYLGELDLLNTNLFDSEAILDEFLGGNYEAKENVYAGYIMATYNLSDKLTALGGVRLESTDITTTGNIVSFDANGDFDPANSNLITQENKYTNILPSIHLKYDVSKNSSIRFAWTNTLARPNYIDIIPFRNIINEDDEIELGNPDLQPTTSMNFDLLGETYFENLGILSGGVFYKRVKDFIYTSISTTTNDDLGPGTTGYQVFRPLNGDDASLFGAEIAIQRQLDFLPGILKNFSVYANYTFISSSANGVRNGDGDLRDDIDLPNTAPNMFNGSLAYADKKLNVRLSVNYSDSYIDEIGGNPLEDRFYDEQFFLDFNANYSISDKLSIYAVINNITDQPLRYFQGRRNRTMQAEYYGQRITFGLKYDLFKKKND